MTIRPKLEFLSSQAVERAIDEAYELLWDPGVRVHYDEALQLLADAGATVDLESRVARIPRGLAEKAVETAPGSFHLYDFYGEPVVHYGGDDIHYDPGSAAIEIADYQSDQSRVPVTADCENITLVHGDILALDPAELMRPPGDAHTPAYLVVANIPYYITSALIRQLLECSQPPVRLVLTVQEEVAERICAAPGEMSLLALSVQVYGRPLITARLPAGAFYPVPQVDSAVIRVDRYAEPLVPAGSLAAFFRLAKAGFSQKRKTLRNALAGGMHWSKKEAAERLEAAGIDPMRRAETLSLEEWKSLLV